MPGPGSLVPSTPEISAAPKAVAEQPAREEAARVLRVDVRRVDVARDRGEQAEVLVGQGPYQARRLADTNLVEGSAFQVFFAHDFPPCTTKAGVLCQFGSRSRYFWTIFAAGELGPHSAGSSIMTRPTIATASSRSACDGSRWGNALARPPDQAA